MTVLITGAGGFLGSRVVPELLRAGVDLVCLRSPASSATAPGPTGCRAVVADVTDASSVRAAREAVGPVEQLVHLAAHVPRSPSADEAAASYGVNLLGTLQLVDAWRDTLEHVVYASTAEVYGVVPRTGPVSEDERPEPPSYYAAGKLAGEHALGLWGQRAGVGVATLRYSVMYGAGDRLSRAIPAFVRRALAGEELEVYGGEEQRDYLHVDDAALATVQAATARAVGVFNIGTGEPTTVREAAEQVIAAVGGTARVAVGARRKPRVDLVLDIERARKAFGYEPARRFPDGLTDVIAWEREQVAR